MRIITLSRQFGSGGRELGKRLSDLLEWDYYDSEIISELAREQALDEEAVRTILSSHGWHHVPLTYRNSFSHMVVDRGVFTQLLVAQRQIVREIAEAGHDCVIVGRDADVILRDVHPFRIFVCADMDSRLERTLRYEERKPEAERLSEKEIRKNIRRIDRNRVRTREILTGRPHGDGSTFDLTVNASGRDLKKLSEALASFALSWFD